MSIQGNIPPKLAQKLLQWFLKDELLEEVTGDLEEKFELDQETYSLSKARRNYWFQVINYIRPFAIKRSKNSITMMKIGIISSFFKVGYRNLLRHKSFSLINVSGLALGLICFLFIFLWVREEMSVDSFHSKSENLYVIYRNQDADGSVQSSFSTPMRWNNGYHIVVDDMEEAIPEVKNKAYYATGYELPWGYPKTFRYGDKKFKLEGSRASEDFFKVFDYQVIAGDQETPLSDVSSMAISRKMAILFFNSPEEAIGQTLNYEDKYDFQVTAVFEDVTDRSSLQFQYLINWESQMKRLEWSSDQVLTTIELQDGADPQIVAAKLDNYLQSRLDENEDFEDHIGLYPFDQKYLHSTFVNGIPADGLISYMKIFSWVGVFILLVASINFMNLTTARSIKRAKEVAMRKVVGSNKLYLIGQFLCESILIAAVAMVLALGAVALLLPIFNSSLNKSISFPMLDYQFWTICVGLIVLVGFVAGSYPALYLSSLRPIQSLKGLIRISKSSIWFRKGLVVFQFSVSIVLLVVTIFITRQTDYLRSKNLGYDRENIISFRVEGTINSSYEVFKNRLLSMPGIAALDRGSEEPQAMGFEVSKPINWQGKDHEVGFKPSSVGYDYLDLMGLEVVEGRGFSKAHPSDSGAFMINEAAVKQMAIDNPVGKWISAWDKRGKIIGVLKDFHSSSLHEPIKPVILDVKEDLYFGVVIVKTKSGQTEEALASLENIYKEMNPNFPLDYKFMDAAYNNMYQTEMVMGKLSNISALLAIVISCLGLFGLAMFTAEQRTKEIGIRKVLGATVNQLIGLFSKDFLLLVMVAFLVALPLSWYLMKQWLESYAYHVDLSWWVFAVAGLASLLVAFGTISFQSVKVALSNPVKSLRAE
ncbi:ABC transporter permease [Marinoscillum pacificum]|uniref:ABC transporter permease n=1 Tax=Marinoscillum pacificum TaxID=392723 RepID=UPI0021577BB4|nr:FtsX-like permease family protein [Marinoscillum pacificum]